MHALIGYWINNSNIMKGNVEKIYNYVRATKRTRKRKDKAASDFFSMA
jgi:hypothetical protein